jgi:hypothetical protein
MALVGDILKGNLLTIAAVGATAVVLPKVLPGLSPPLRSAIKGGVSLFLESEAEAEGGIIGRLAQDALEAVLASLSGPGSAEERHQAAQAAVEDFKRTARTRARRYGRDEDGRLVRYERHVAALRHGLERARSRHTGAKAAALSHLLVSLADAQPHAG